MVSFQQKSFPPQLRETASPSQPPATLRGIKRLYAGVSIGVFVAVAGVSVGVCLLHRHNAGNAAHSVAQTSKIAAVHARHPQAIDLRAAKRAAAAISDPLRPLLSQYSAGHYSDVERAAIPFLAAGAQPKASLPVRKAAVRARHLTAFTAARQHNMKLAQERFAQARAEAAKLPGGGRPDTPPAPGAPPAPSLEEDSAYQHAVCTSALGDKAGAEHEYLRFMQDYPESPLVQASIKRIARLHGGNIPEEAQGVWQAAMQTAQDRAKSHQRDESVCAPECLAEMMRRSESESKSGTMTETTGFLPPTVKALADEMKTDENGTALADLCASAQRHGFPGAKGLSVTWEGLRTQRLPLIALVQSRHFVIVEKADANGVAIWDPDGGEGIGKPVRHTLTPEWWRKHSSGVVLALMPSSASGVRTASR